MCQKGSNSSRRPWHQVITSRHHSTDCFNTSYCSGHTTLRSHFATVDWTCSSTPSPLCIHFCYRYPHHAWITPSHFVQFTADTVGHIIRTLNGHKTFHEMGIIAGVTPGTKHHRQVPRISATAEDLTALSIIDIHSLSLHQVPLFADHEPDEMSNDIGGSNEQYISDVKFIVFGSSGLLR